MIAEDGDSTVYLTDDERVIVYLDSTLDYFVEDDPQRDLANRLSARVPRRDGGARARARAGSDRPLMPAFHPAPLQDLGGFGIRWYDENGVRRRKAGFVGVAGPQWFRTSSGRGCAETPL